MTNQKLVDYVNEKLKQGLDKETISKELASANWSTKDIEETFSDISNGGVNNTSTKIVLFVQIIIIIFAISLVLSAMSCGEGSGYCGYAQGMLLIPTIFFYLIFAGIGSSIYSKKVKLYKLNNTKIPMILKLLHIIQKTVISLFVVFIIIRIFAR
jgi:hypothetical protein